MRRLADSYEPPFLTKISTSKNQVPAETIPMACAGRTVLVCPVCTMVRCPVPAFGEGFLACALRGVGAKTPHSSTTPTLPCVWHAVWKLHEARLPCMVTSRESTHHVILIGLHPYKTANHEEAKEISSQSQAPSTNPNHPTLQVSLKDQAKWEALKPPPGSRSWRSNVHLNSSIHKDLEL